MHPRPALPVPAQIAARYALPGPVTEEWLVPVGREDGVAFYRGSLRSGDQQIALTYLRPIDAARPPFALCLPILAGGRALMWMVGSSLAHRGYAVAWTPRAGSPLAEGQRGPEMEALLRRSVVHNRAVLEWARAQSNLDSGPMACVGISLGGIVAGVLLAVEPELGAAALVLAGGDLAGLMMVSAERRVVRWRRWRHLADGLSGSELHRELVECLVSDPALLGPYIPTEKVLMVGCALDRVVPRRHQDLLWESLGRPLRHTLPLGHYTAAIAFSSIISTVHSFFRQRLGPPAPPTRAAAQVR